MKVFIFIFSPSDIYSTPKTHLAIKQERTDTVLETEIHETERASCCTRPALFRPYNNAENRSSISVICGGYFLEKIRVLLALNACDLRV